MQASLIIPVYNAESTLWPLYERVCRQVQSSDLDVELVFVDDASSDNSLAVLYDIERNSANVVVVSNSVNRGQGKGTLAGVAVAKRDVLITLDDDLQHRPEDIPRLLAEFAQVEANSLVMGISAGRRRAFWRHMVGFGANAISNLFLDKPLPLRLTTFCVFGRTLCRGIASDEDRGVALMTELVQAADRTVTVPLSVSLDVQQPGNYTVRTLFSLFASRSRVYRFKRVLYWLTSCLMLSIAATWASLVSHGWPSIFAAAIWLISCPASLLLIALATRMRRHASSINRWHDSTD